MSRKRKSEFDEKARLISCSNESHILFWLLQGQHPNIVTVREIVVGSNMDKIFIVMDYVEHDLKSLMETMRGKKQVFLPGIKRSVIILRSWHFRFCVFRNVWEETSRKVEKLIKKQYLKNYHNFYETVLLGMYIVCSMIGYYKKRNMLSPQAL